ncbi:MAG: hypothetical protein DRO15_02820 [Thermoprotei archaeon]|nr:MAG: hypothetical protein DRO15_02820 [Thermoprotei archaeon]
MYFAIETQGAYAGKDYVTIGDSMSDLKHLFSKRENPVLKIEPMILTQIYHSTTRFRWGLPQTVDYE